MEQLSLLTSMAAVLGVALIAGMAVRRLGLPVILGYLLGGVAIGPYGLELVKDVGEVETLATIGVALRGATTSRQRSTTPATFPWRIAAASVWTLIPRGA